MSRENQNREHDGNYLSEEELEKLIAEVETNSMLHAPHNLKDEILQAAEQERSDLSAAKEITGKRSAVYQRSRRRAFFLYVLEVEAVSAAAIAMLFLTPVRNADTHGQAGSSALHRAHGAKATRGTNRERRRKRTINPLTLAVRNGPVR